jgi:hypothetical protein
VTLDRTICRDNCAGWGAGTDAICGPVDRLVTLRCSDVEMSGVEAPNLVTENVIDEDVHFCDPRSCYILTTAGDYTLRSDSPCLPTGNPCGVLIGALDMGCLAPGAGACCLLDGICLLVTTEGCTTLHGAYQGVGTNCAPDLCVPTPVEPTSWGRIKATYRDAVKR